ncbi:MAG TPA: lysylphosphatidylglycerol synthase domain-containing protein, partial [Gaiellaceae bacterium]|nr:lysylphosphatidylglycerol synthase domain-containing protein [Gaiellaceae bacterium]
MNLESLMSAVDSAATQIGELDARFLLPALALQLLALGFRALAWRGVLAAAYPGRRIPFVSVGVAYVTGVALNAFTPARGGELAKIAIVRTRIPGTTVPTIVASLTVVLALDALLGGALLVGVWATGGLPALPAPPGLA